MRKISLLFMMLAFALCMMAQSTLPKPGNPSITQWIDYGVYVWEDGYYNGGSLAGYTLAKDVSNKLVADDYTIDKYYTGGEYTILDPEKVTFSIFTDNDQIFTFTPDFFDQVDEPVTQFPYTSITAWGNVGNSMITFEEKTNDVDVLAEMGITLERFFNWRIGIQTQYTDNGQTSTSDIVYMEIYPQLKPAAEVTSIFFQLNDMLREETIKKVVYKPIPWIYHQQPAEEDLYAIMKVCQAKIIARNLSSAISKKCPNKWYRIRECGSRKASAAGLYVEESEDWKAFWDILADNLQHKYQLAPVHTVNELLLLHQRFPKQIRLVVVKEGQTVIGGTVLYVTNCVVHSQYIAANERGKELHALDLLFDQVISKSLSGHAFFDFGISTEEHGTYLNEKLIYQKEGFGGRGICYDWYEWDL